MPLKLEGSGNEVFSLRGFLQKCWVSVKGVVEVRFPISVECNGSCKDLNEECKKNVRCG